MTAAWLQVDPVLLKELAQKLEAGAAIARDVDSGRGGLAERADGAGSPEVREALHDFLDRWGHGCESLAEDARQIAERLRAASRVYAQVEGGIAAAAGRHEL